MESSSSLYRYMPKEAPVGDPRLTARSLKAIDSGCNGKHCLPVCPSIFMFTSISMFTSEYIDLQLFSSCMYKYIYKYVCVHVHMYTIYIHTSLYLFGHHFKWIGILKLFYRLESAEAQSGRLWISAEGCHTESWKQASPIRIQSRSYRRSVLKKAQGLARGCKEVNVEVGIIVLLEVMGLRSTYLKVQSTRISSIYPTIVTIPTLLTLHTHVWVPWSFYRDSWTLFVAECSFRQVSNKPGMVLALDERVGGLCLNLCSRSSKR